MTSSFASWEVNPPKLPQLVSMFKYQETPNLLALDPLPDVRNARKKVSDFTLQSQTLTSVHIRLL